MPLLGRSKGTILTKAEYLCGNLWKINLEREFVASFSMVLNVRLWDLGLVSSNEISS